MTQRFSLSRFHPEFHPVVPSGDDGYSVCSESLSQWIDTLSLFFGWGDYVDERNAGILHQIDVANICVPLADAMGLDLHEQVFVFWAGYHHDDGKALLTPAVVAALPPLPHNIRGERRKHPSLGAGLVRKFFRVPDGKRIALIVEQHHENYDGSGYPHRLSRKDISLGARILRVADVFHSSQRRRPDPSLDPIGYAHSVIDQGRGTMYDPDVCDALLSLPCSVLSSEPSKPAFAGARLRSSACQL